VPLPVVAKDLVPLGSRVLDVAYGTDSVSRIIADTPKQKSSGSNPIRVELLPAIRCFGEALGFVTGDHAAIPDSADRFISADFRDCLRSRAFFIPR
jgi:hypothetical protein